MYKVFVNNQTIHFIKKIELQLFEVENIDIQQFQSNRFLLKIIDDFLNQNLVTDLYIYCPDNLAEVFTFYKSKFIEIKAGGGVVINQFHEILMIFRRGKWDLPKGKLDKGETISQCAIREIEEETSISNLDIIRKLPDTYHIYSEGNKSIIKHCYWFVLKSNDTKKPLPQLDEDILDAIWVNNDKVTELMDNTFPSIKFILNKYLKLQKL